MFAALTHTHHRRAKRQSLASFVPSSPPAAVHGSGYGGEVFKLWVGCGKLGVDGGITKEDLEEAFEKFGKVQKVWVARQPSGFAFIEFGDERDAQDAIKEMDGAELRGERLKVEMSTGGVSVAPSVPFTRDGCLVA